MCFYTVPCEILMLKTATNLFLPPAELIRDVKFN